MRNDLRLAVILSVLITASDSAFADPRTVTLDIQNVSCAICAPIVKRTLSRVLGVSRVAVVEHDGTATATVTFDDAKVTPDALVTAATNAGYPAAVARSAR
jgi:mercuric ion binding protein